MVNKFWKFLGFFWPPALVFIVNYVLDLGFNAYEFYPNMDIIFHLLGGASIALTFTFILTYLKRARIYKSRSFFVDVFFIVGAVGLFAIFWEFYEYLITVFFGLEWIGDLGDTLFDLFLGLVGGLCIAVLSKLQRV